MNRYFGTDGIRGRAGAMLTPELALRAAFGFAQMAADGQRFRARQRPLIVVGCDSRLSSPMLEAAVCSGIALAGCDALRLAIVPTPVVPLMVLAQKAAGGVMITASHNPIEDNGIKLFGGDGLKISPARGVQIERVIDQPEQCRVPQEMRFGELKPLNPKPGYLAFVKRALGIRPGGAALRIVLDCAYGATCELAPAAFASAGFKVLPIHAEFDGARVNVQCGATSLAALSAQVLKSRADFGLAFDGDGDRVLAIDHAGRPVNGDQIIALFATRLPRYRREGAIVMTQMTNMGVEEALEQRGIKLLRTDVGDTLVLEELIRRDLHLGGEQSGHVIMRDKLPTGDGILAGLQLALLVRRAGKPLADLAAEFPQYPQQLTNLKVRDRKAWQRDQQFRREFASVRAHFRKVRFYLRPSGTEDLVRVLTEARDHELCRLGNEAACAVFAAWDARLK